MNYQKHFTHSIISCISIFFLFSCAEDGGIDGEQGPPGKDGEDGAANIYYSEWIENTMADSDAGYVSDDIAEFDTSQYSLNTSVILAYGKTESGRVDPLPRQVAETIYGYFVEPPLSGAPLLARLFVYRDGTIPNGVNNPTHFRYILIPGGTPVGGRTINYSEMDYQEICTLFGISD